MKKISFPFTVALGNSSSQNEGRIDILDGGVWSVVMSNNHNNQVVEVVCRELGFPGALSTYVTPNRMANVYKDIACKGDENYLSECSYVEHRYDSFNVSNALGVICESRK